MAGSQGFPPVECLISNFNLSANNSAKRAEASLKCLLWKSNAVNYSSQPQSFQSTQQFPCAPTAGRSSAGRPPHALVTFGFGGKLIVMKDNSSFGSSSFGSQNPNGGSISVLNLMDVMSERTDSLRLPTGAYYFIQTVCRNPFSGPLIGGNAGIKELNKWIDKRIANSEFPDMDYRKGEVLKLLVSLLKIACQYYGKLRSPFWY